MGWLEYKYKIKGGFAGIQIQKVGFARIQYGFIVPNTLLYLKWGQFFESVVAMTLGLGGKKMRHSTFWNTYIIRGVRRNKSNTKKWISLHGIRI